MEENNPFTIVHYYFLKMVMEKLKSQDILIKQLTTRETEEESGDLLKREDSKCS